MRAAAVAPALVLTLVGYASTLDAQTTAGSGTTMVFPVTAQTASFASEVTLFNPGPSLLTASVAFYEAQNSSAPGPKTCNDVSVPAARSVQFQIATQCALASGSHFGLLVVADKALPPVNSFYGYTRVQNPQGIGFSIEGFPAQNFNNQVSHATGLKKQAASPTYQTNCFVGSLDQAVNYELRLFDDASGVQIGGTIVGSLGAFQQFRYLDVFGVNGVNAPAGDQTNVRAQFTQTSGGSANLIGFCTVQDNTSFGADFRIAKSYGSPSGSFFVQGGNAFGATAVLGTTDNQELQIRVNNLRALRIVPDDTSPLITGGFLGNSVVAGASGGTVAGGGAPGSSLLGHTCGGISTACRNSVSDAFGTVGGGAANRAGDAGGTATDRPFAVVGGGFGNKATGDSSIVAGGSGNTASNSYSVVGGGLANTASGIQSMVPGGAGNVAAGDVSFAGGAGAKANATGMFVWSDLGPSASAFDPSISPPGWSSPANTFNVRATGGIWFVTGVDVSGTPTWGCTLTNGAGLFCASDRNLKRNLAQLDGKRVLAKLAAMPLYEWQPKDGPNADDRHIGPMAQDFYATFGLGHTDKAIGFQDVDGVALAAIQGLHQLVQEKDAQIAALTNRVTELESLRSELAALKAAVAELRLSPASIAAAANARSIDSKRH